MLEGTFSSPYHFTVDDQNGAMWLLGGAEGSSR